MDGYGVRPAPRDAAVHDRLSSRGSRPRRACTCWPRPTGGCATRPAGRTGPAGRRPATCRRSISPISRRSAARCAEWGLDGRVRVPRRGRSRRRRSRSCRAGRVLGAGDLRRAEGHVPARGDGQRRAGRAAAPRRVPRDGRRRPAAACSSSPTIRRRSPTRCLELLAEPRAGRGAGRAGAAGVREHYDVGRMAEAAESAYASSPRRTLTRGHADRRPRFEELSHAARRSADPRRRVAVARRAATRWRSWGRRAAARARCSTSSARSSRRRPAP